MYIYSKQQQQQQQQNLTNQKTIKHKKQTKQNKNMEICLSKKYKLNFLAGTFILIKNIKDIRRDA